MQFEYHWDGELYECLLKYRARQIINAIMKEMREREMATPADIQKLVERMQRSHNLINAAVAKGDKAEAVMNSFEQRLGHFDEHMDKISQYDQQLAYMMAVTGNGGPALDATFQQDAPQPTAGSTVSAPPIDLATGDPVRGR